MTVMTHTTTIVIFTDPPTTHSIVPELFLLLLVQSVDSIVTLGRLYLLNVGPVDSLVRHGPLKRNSANPVHSIITT